MKKSTIFISFFVVALFAFAGSLFAEWTKINDHMEIDYEKYILKIYFSSPNNSQTVQLKKTKLLFNYISNLNIIDSDQKVSDRMKSSPIVESKIKASIIKSTQTLDTTVLGNDEVLYELSYDLNLVEKILPEVELPLRP